MNSEAKETKECGEVSNLVKEENNADEREELSLISLCDSVLLHVFSFLDWIDAIHLAGTCVRLHKVNFWKYKKRQEFNLNEYLKRGQIPVKKMLTTYGPHIDILSAMTDDIDQDIVKNCLNVRSLYILDQYRGPNDKLSEDTLILIITWCKQLNLEGLSLPSHCDEQLSKLLYENLSNLKELTLYPMDDVDDAQEYLCLERNANVERLRISLACDTNFRTLSNLQHLQCLHVDNCDVDDFDKLLKHVKLDGLTEFSVTHLADQHKIVEFNSFLKGLAKVTNLDKLDVLVCQCIDNDTFCALKLFNLTTLTLSTNFTIEDFTKFILDYPAPRRLKYFKSQFLYSPDIMNIAVKLMVRHWTNLETICCARCVRQQFDNSFTNDILKISTDRLPLTLEIHNDKVLSKEILITTHRIKV